MRYLFGFMCACALGVIPLVGCDDGQSQTTGFLIDSAVSGVAYETPTHQGVTGVDGSFRYEEGETVRFTLGDTLLGEVTGNEEVTPFDLADSPVITGTRNLRQAIECAGFSPGSRERTMSIDSCRFHLESVEKSESFSTVLNIAALLQSLDRDANPENGIEISPDVAELFTGVSLDLRQPWDAFPRDFDFRHVLGQANAQGLFSEAHGAVNPAPALQHLYETLGIDPQIAGVTTQEADNDADGTPDSIIESYQYDVNGNLIRLVSQNWSWQYDANGNLTRWEYDVDGDSVIESWHYDATGHLIRKEEDWDDDGTPNAIESWQYDADGNVTRTELDSPADETLYSIGTAQYDANGNLTRSETESNCCRSARTHQYDSDGNEIRQEWDEDADGTPESITTHAYDANGNLIRSEFDGGGDDAPDGIPDRIHSQHYDANGNLIRSEFDGGGDDAPDGIQDRIHSYQYDVNGNLIRSESDYDGDGTADAVESWQYDYDARGNLTQYQTDQEFGREIHIWQYDANGNQTRWEYDLDADSTPDSISSYQYDGNGNLIRSEFDGDGDGTPDYITSYGYEATGWGHLFPRWPRLY